MTSPNPFPSPPTTPGVLPQGLATPLPGATGIIAGANLAGLADEPTGTLARTVPRVNITSVTLGALSTTGLIAARAILLPAGIVVSNISFLFGTTGATGPTHLWAALTDGNLNVLAVTADATGNTQTASTFTTLAVATKFVTGYNGLYYVMVSSSASTTAPTLAGGPVVGAGAVAGPPVFCGSAGSSSTPPAVNTVVNSGTITAAGGSNIAAWIS